MLWHIQPVVEVGLTFQTSTNCFSVEQQIVLYRVFANFDSAQLIINFILMHDEWKWCHRFILDTEVQRFD